ncbi:MAG: site-specific integrase [Phycisphaerae bacterium]
MRSPVSSRRLTDEELARLIQTAEEGDDVLGMPGPERAMLYRLAVGTGFRAGELRSLTPESFDLDAEPPTVTVEAGYSKHRREDVQPIRQDLADVLRPWLEGKERGEPVFKMPSKTAKMMREDLAEAGIEYRDAAGRVADFHALRHTYISRLVRSGVNVKVAQELARHSTPTLTLGRYAHVQLVDQTQALDALPAIEGTAIARRTRQAISTAAV